MASFNCGGGDFVRPRLRGHASIIQCRRTAPCALACRRLLAAAAPPLAIVCEDCCTATSCTRASSEVALVERRTRTFVLFSHLLFDQMLNARRQFERARARERSPAAKARGLRRRTATSHVQTSGTRACARGDPTGCTYASACTRCFGHQHAACDLNIRRRRAARRAPRVTRRARARKFNFCCAVAESCSCWRTCRRLRALASNARQQA